MTFTKICAEGYEIMLVFHYFLFWITNFFLIMQL